MSQAELWVQTFGRPPPHPPYGGLPDCNCSTYHTSKLSPPRADHSETHPLGWGWGVGANAPEMECGGRAKGGGGAGTHTTATGQGPPRPQKRGRNAGVPWGTTNECARGVGVVQSRVTPQCPPPISHAGNAVATGGLTFEREVGGGGGRSRGPRPAEAGAPGARVMRQ